MKKIIIALFAAFLAVSASAQPGIVGGFTSSQTDLKSAIGDIQNINLYHIGVTYHKELAMGFAIQPALIYNVKGAEMQNLAGVSDVNFKTGYLELPVQIQWGVDLALLRPYVFVEPFLGYAVNNVLSMNTLGQLKDQQTWDNVKSRFEYGVGFGAGVDVLKFVQVSVRYFWNLGSIYGSDITLGGVTKTIGESKCSGIMASAAIFF